MTLDALIAVAAGYLLGAIPVGYLLVRLRTGADIRQSGSGATGATNAGRALGRAGFAVVFVLDVLKGAGAVALAGWLGAPGWAVAVAGGAAIAGHIWPVWLGFRGGRGLATGFGAGLVLSPITAGLALVVLAALVPFLRPRLVPLVVAVASTPPLALAVDRPAAGGVALIAALILVGHQSNIRDVLEGDTVRGRIAVGWRGRGSDRTREGSER